MYQIPELQSIEMAQKVFENQCADIRTVTVKQLRDDFLWRPGNIIPDWDGAQPNARSVIVPFDSGIRYKVSQTDRETQETREVHCRPHLEIFPDDGSMKIWYYIASNAYSKKHRGNYAKSLPGNERQKYDEGLKFCTDINGRILEVLEYRDGFIVSSSANNTKSGVRDEVRAYFDDMKIIIRVKTGVRTKDGEDEFYDKEFEDLLAWLEREMEAMVTNLLITSIFNDDSMSDEDKLREIARALGTELLDAATCVATGGHSKDGEEDDSKKEEKEEVKEEEKQEVPEDDGNQEPSPKPSTKQTKKQTTKPDAKEQECHEIEIEKTKYPGFDKCGKNCMKTAKEVLNQANVQ